jgi:hypothetical protein
MIALFDFLGTLVKRLLIAVFLLGGLLLAMLIAIKVLIVMAIVRFFRGRRTPSSPSAAGNVFDGEYSVVKPGAASRATVLMVEPSKTSSGAP